MGSANFIENDTYFKLNENNFFTFKTRRNKKLNLTEYYDLVYEYKNGKYEILGSNLRDHLE